MKVTMASSTKLEDLPTEILDLIVNKQDLEIDDAKNLREASKLFRDVVDLNKEKWKCVNYIRNANNLTERCENGDFSEEEKICQRKHNLCEPLNVKAFFSLPQVTVPYGTTWVGKKTFSNINIRRVHIVLPKTVKNIDTGALEDNINVIKVSAPGVEKVQDSAFDGCESLEVFEAPKLRETGERAFAFCDLKTFYGPLLTSIGPWSFYSCDLLKRIKFPRCEKIANHAFFECIDLQIAEFSQVLEIGQEAFALCPSLRVFMAPQARDIDYQAFYGCESLQTVDSDEVREIYDEAFAFCDALKEFAGYRLKHIGFQAFHNCKSLEKVWAPSVRSIGDEAFEGCLNLRKITISRKTEIGKDAIPENTDVFFIQDIIAEKTRPIIENDGYTF